MKKKKNQACGSEWKEETDLLDDPGGSPIEWLDLHCDPVRRNVPEDPWDRPSFASENDALTERRRRKLQHLSVCTDLDWNDDRGDHVA